MPEINNTQEDVSVVSENEELKAAFIKFNNSYLERFSSLDNSIKSLNSSIEKLDTEKGVSVVDNKVKNPSNFGYQKTLDVIQKKLFSFKEKLDEINSPIFNSFLKYLESNEDLNKEMNSKLNNIEEGLGEVNNKEEKGSGLLDLIFNGIGNVLKKGFGAIKKIIETFAKNFFTKGILVRAFGAVLLGLLGAEFAEKLGVPNYWAKPLAYGAAGWLLGPWGAFGGAAIGTAQAMFENEAAAEKWRQEHPVQQFKNAVIGKSESDNDYNAVVFKLNQFKKGRNLTDMTISEILSMQSDLIQHTKNNPKYADLLPHGMGTSAVGKYQVTKETLQDFLNWASSTEEGRKFNEEYKITRSSKFDEKVQEMIANYLLVNRIKIDDYLSGKIDVDQMLARLNKTWSGVNPSDNKKVMTRHEHRVELMRMKERLNKKPPTNSATPVQPNTNVSDNLNKVTSLNENNGLNDTQFAANLNDTLNSVADKLESISGKNRDSTNVAKIGDTPTPGQIDFAWHKTNHELTGSPHSNVYA